MAGNRHFFKMPIPKEKIYAILDELHDKYNTQFDDAEIAYQNAAKLTPGKINLTMIARQREQEFANGALEVIYAISRELPKIDTPEPVPPPTNKTGKEGEQ